MKRYTVTIEAGSAADALALAKNIPGFTLSWDKHILVEQDRFFEFYGDAQQTPQGPGVVKIFEWTNPSLPPEAFVSTKKPNYRVGPERTFENGRKGYLDVWGQQIYNTF